MNRWVKNGLIAVLIIFLGYNSVYLEKLSDRDKKGGSGIDAAALAGEVWQKKVPAKLDSAVSIDSLKALIEANDKTVFNKYTHALDIGNYRYALVKGRATIKSVNEDDIRLFVRGKKPFNAALVTEFVYGNTLRDALGIFNLKDFPNTEDLNSISAQLNKIVRTELVPSFRGMLKPGMDISFVGAIQINKAHVHFDGMEIVPLRIKIVE